MIFIDDLRIHHSNYDMPPDTGLNGRSRKKGCPIGLKCSNAEAAATPLSLPVDVAAEF